MHFPTWVDLKGLDAVPETVHHVVCYIDPVADTSWHSLSRKVKVCMYSEHAGLSTIMALVYSCCYSADRWYSFKGRCKTWNTFTRYVVELLASGATCVGMCIGMCAWL